MAAVESLMNSINGKIFTIGGGEDDVFTPDNEKLEQEVCDICTPRLA